MAGALGRLCDASAALEEFETTGWSVLAGLAEPFFVSEEISMFVRERSCGTGDRHGESEGRMRRCKMERMNVKVCGAATVDKDKTIDRDGGSTPVQGLVAQRGRDRAGSMNGAREGRICTFLLLHRLIGTVA